jgi:hypothetical protein
MDTKNYGPEYIKSLIEMTNEEKLTLWLGAYRYYCGRMTYAVGDFCDLLRKEWDNLPEYTKNLIKVELEETFARDDKIRPHDHYAPLGADCDRKEWEKVRALWGEK